MSPTRRASYFRPQKRRSVLSRSLKTLVRAKVRQAMERVRRDPAIGREPTVRLVFTEDGGVVRLD